jgi:hypothetical protein
MYLLEDSPLRLTQLDTKDGWLEQSVLAIAGDFTVDDDRRQIVDVMLGLWAFMLMGEKTVNSRSRQYVEDRKGEVFASKFFGDLALRLEDEVQKARADEGGSAVFDDKDFLLLALAKSEYKKVQGKELSPDLSAIIDRLTSKQADIMTLAAEWRSKVQVAAEGASPTQRGGRRRGSEGSQPRFEVGDCAFMLNPKYLDGTRLRAGPHIDDEFNGQFVLNDQQVEILALKDGLAKICSCGQGVTDETRVVGWVRTRNLSTVKRALGLEPSLLAKAASSGVRMAAVVSASAAHEPAEIPVAETSSTHEVRELNIEIREEAPGPAAS